jgi:ABC-type lipoprotein release transport system permease subunit
VGIGAGSLVSVAVARILTAAMVGLGAPSPVIYIVVPVALFVVTMGSCYLPARRASHLDPVMTLRYE